MPLNPPTQNNEVKKPVDETPKEQTDAEKDLLEQSNYAKTKLVDEIKAFGGEDVDKV